MTKSIRLLYKEARAFDRLREDAKCEKLNASGNTLTPLRRKNLAEAFSFIAFDFSQAVVRRVGFGDMPEHLVPGYLMIRGIPILIEYKQGNPSGVTPSIYIYKDDKVFIITKAYHHRAKEIKTEIVQKYFN